VGDELVTGHVQDVNGARASLALGERGFHVQAMQVVRDDRNQLVRAIKKAQMDAEVVLLSGGLGPTEDDLTREAIAEATGAALVQSEELLQTLQDRFAARGRAMSESNLRQAFLPEGAQAIANSRGTAPGIYLPRGSRTIVALPGVPFEFQTMLQDEVLEMLCEGYSETLLPSGVRTLLVTGLPESVVGERVAQWMQPGENPRLGITAKRGGISLRMVASGEEERSAEELLDAREAELREALGDDACPGHPRTPEEAVVSFEGMDTIAVVDGLGGGSLAARLRRVGARVLGWSGDEAFLRSTFPELTDGFGAVEIAAAAAARAGTRGSVAVLAGEAGFHFLAAVVGDRAHEAVTVPTPDGEADIWRCEARSLDLLRRLAQGVEVPVDSGELEALAELGDAVREVEGEGGDPLEALEDLEVELPEADPS
jgi:nicotinamide-nucleotide amidase